MIFVKEPAFQSSTKIESLLEAVVKMRAEEPTAKAEPSHSSSCSTYTHIHEGIRPYTYTHTPYTHMSPC